MDIYLNGLSYGEASEGYEGFCVDCKEWTRSMCEPDARDYDCPDCEGKTVIGADEVLLNGWFS